MSSGEAILSGSAENTLTIPSLHKNHWETASGRIERHLYLDPATMSWLSRQHTHHTDVAGIPTTCLQEEPVNAYKRTSKRERTLRLKGRHQEQEKRDRHLSRLGERSPLHQTPPPLPTSLEPERHWREGTRRLQVCHTHRRES